MVLIFGKKTIIFIISQFKWPVNSYYKILMRKIPKRRTFGNQDQAACKNLYEILHLVMVHHFPVNYGVKRFG